MAEIKTEKTFRVSIEMAGDLAIVKQVCREFCYEEGLCVTVSPATFIYTAGEEEGVKIGLLNYPRFPATPDALKGTADRLARLLMWWCRQSSALLVADDESKWISVRDELATKRRDSC